MRSCTPGRKQCIACIWGGSRRTRDNEASISIRQQDSESNAHFYMPSFTTVTYQSSKECRGGIVGAEKEYRERTTPSIRLSTSYDCAEAS
ncbi:hypothetical protein IG631_06441 [Alternaria alternata]|nr:hypothetical protein IG631_06441 [Alternaria alternata]